MRPGAQAIPQKLQNCGFLWADVAGFQANPGVPFVNASWPSFFSQLTHLFLICNGH
jgi:hypothetical protein